jgi:hypothetical protein
MFCYKSRLVSNLGAERPLLTLITGETMYKENFRETLERILLLCLAGALIYFGVTGLTGCAKGEFTTATKYCTTTQQPAGALVQCPDGSQSFIANGINGINGLNGTDGATPIIEVVDPCGKQTSFDEVLYRLPDGRLLAHFDNGALQFLTILTPGTYTTTDGSKCQFTVDANNKVTNEHNY